MKKLWMLGLAVVLAPSLGAQQHMMRDSAKAAQLRARIDSVFTSRVQQELKLTADQTTKLRATQERFGARRRALMQQQLERRRALNEQMQPGVAANADSVNKLMEGIRSARAELLKIEQDEDREMAGYLTPVQRARFMQMRERLMERVGEMRRGRGQGKGMRPGMRPRGPMGPGRRPI